MRKMGNIAIGIEFEVNFLKNVNEEDNDKGEWNTTVT
jgi:hypothetical protein